VKRSQSLENIKGKAAFDSHFKDSTLLLALSARREGAQSSTQESASIEFLEVESTKRSVPKPGQKVHPPDE
jgi:hypothetical protein